ncbi:MAG: TrkH family potassium uptake protein [Acetanaerobacterium sp.]
MHFAGTDKRQRPAHRPVRTITLSFAFVILVGTVVLMMPFSSRSGSFTPFFDALFTATSATCVTGLVLYDTFLQWSAIGQAIILVLIQIGGLGLLTITTFFNLAIGRKLGLRGVHLASETANALDLPDAPKLVKTIMLVSFSCEAVGALLLMVHFVPSYGREGVFLSVFLAVSAFCNAGFDLLGREGAYSSLSHYNDNPYVLLVIVLLIVLGGLGFLVWKDLAQYRKTKKLLLHTRVVIVMTGALIVFGTFVFLLFEWNNGQTLGALPASQRFVASLFQSVTTRTAGFNTIDMNSLNGVTKMFVIILMFIGAAPGSTGGGIKITTFAILVMTVVSVVRGQDETIIFKRRVDKHVVYKALAVVLFAFMFILVATSIIYFTSVENIDGMNALFESVSAFCTVGLSTGVTAVANLPSRLMIILSMFFGRVGPVSFALALTLRQGRRHEIIPDGKIIVG